MVDIEDKPEEEKPKPKKRRNPKPKDAAADGEPKPKKPRKKKVHSDSDARPARTLVVLHACVPALERYLRKIPDPRSDDPPGACAGEEGRGGSRR